MKLFGLFLLIVIAVQAFLTTIRLLFFPDTSFGLVLFIGFGTGMVVMYSLIKYFDNKKENATEQGSR